MIETVVGMHFYKKLQPERREVIVAEPHLDNALVKIQSKQKKALTQSKRKEFCNYSKEGPGSVNGDTVGLE